MNYNILKNELQVDPLNRGYSGMDDASVAADLNTEYRTVVGETRATALTLMRRFGALQAAAFLDKLDSASQEAGYAMAPVLRHVIPFLYTGEGVDLGDSQTRALLVQLYQDGKISQTEANGLKSLADKVVSRAEELGLGQVNPGLVWEARRLMGV